MISLFHKKFVNTKKTKHKLKNNYKNYFVNAYNKNPYKDPTSKTIIKLYKNFIIYLNNIMKLKSILYKKEQDGLVDKIINILELDNENSIILYNLDNDQIKQDRILKLIPEIRKYYSFSSIIGASEPTKAKRPYLSIIRQLTKSKYKLNSYDYRIKQDGKEDIRTKKYIFELL